MEIIDYYGKIIKNSKNLKKLKEIAKRLETIKKFEKYIKNIEKIDEYLVEGYFKIGIYTLRKGKRNKTERYKARKLSNYYLKKMYKIIDEDEKIRKKVKRNYFGEAVKDLYINYKK
ncbi:MAG: hypothetical protein QXQ30_01740 [Candidatus Pacearchaeota archaeon]